MVEVERISELPDGWGFRVQVSDAGSQAEYQVTTARAHPRGSRPHARLASRTGAPERLVHRDLRVLGHPQV